MPFSIFPNFPKFCPPSPIAKISSGGGLNCLPSLPPRVVYAFDYVYNLHRIVMSYCMHACYTSYSSQKVVTRSKPDRYYGGGTAHSVSNLGEIIYSALETAWNCMKKPVSALPMYRTAGKVYRNQVQGRCIACAVTVCAQQLHCDVINFHLDI